MPTSLFVGVPIGNGFDLAAGLKTGTTNFILQLARAHRLDDGPVERLAGHRVQLLVHRARSRSVRVKGLFAMGAACGRASKGRLGPAS